MSWTPLSSEVKDRVAQSSSPCEEGSVEEFVPGKGTGNHGRLRALAAVVIFMSAAMALAFFSRSSHHKNQEDPQFLSLAATESAASEAGPVAAFDTYNLKAKNYDKKDGLWCVGLNAVGFDLHPTARREMGTATVPDHEALRYFHQQGSNCFRLAITWERLQTNVGADTIDPVDGFDGVIDFVTNTLGAYIIIDPHNNDEGLQFNGVDVTRSDFVNLWKGITKKYGSNEKCIFGLYNEPRFGFEDGTAGYFDPNVLDRDGRVIEYWRQWMQSAIDAIRALGAKNLILVPGLHWTGCADWSGNWWWGETLEGKPNQGNSRLAALTDPENYIAYDVHQYMDPRFTGQEDGCKGHDLNFYCKDSPDCTGADNGLEETIKWAQYYNKKLFMTEIGSYPAADGSAATCSAKMCNYLKRMHESNTFIGYTVWQFGCPQCDADQWTKKPLNLDWYLLANFSNISKCKDAGGTCATVTCPVAALPTLMPLPGPAPVCSEPHEDCRTSLCCKDASKTCFLKNEYWASCKDHCTPGEKDDQGEEWECEALAHAPEDVPAAHGVDCDTETPCQGSTGTARDVCIAEARLTCCETTGNSREDCCQLDSIKAVFPGTGETALGEDKCQNKCGADWGPCGVSQCCANKNFKCFKKDDTYAQCRDANSCPPPEDTEPWSCAQLPSAGSAEGAPVVDLSCSMASESCKKTECCQDKSKTCYEKDAGWSACRPTDTCTKGKYSAEAGTEWNTNWTCSWTDKSCKFAVAGNRTRLTASVACPTLGPGWEPVSSEARCRNVKLLGEPFEEFRVVNEKKLRHHPTGCSTSLEAAFKLGKWNNNTESENGCSKWGPCVCQKCDPILN
jgi:endoglucanase